MVTNVFYSLWFIVADSFRTNQTDWNYLCIKRFYCTPSSQSESSI